MTSCYHSPLPQPSPPPPPNLEIIQKAIRLILLLRNFSVGDSLQQQYISTIFPTYTSTSKRKKTTENMTQAVTSQRETQQQQQIQQQRQAAGSKQVQERNASASASVCSAYIPPSPQARYPLLHGLSNYTYAYIIVFILTTMIFFLKKKAGLNLNLFGALSGAFSSKKSKTTQNNSDGSSVTHEESHDKGRQTPFLSFFNLFFPPPSSLFPRP